MICQIGPRLWIKFCNQIQKMNAITTRGELLVLLNLVMIVINVILISYSKRQPTWIKSLNEQTNAQDSGGNENINDKEITQRHWVFDPEYEIPDIEHTTLVDCQEMLSGSKHELKKALQTMEMRPKIPIPEEKYIEWTDDCERFKVTRGFITSPLSQEEADYPLAFSIAIYKDVEQYERLLRMIYQPQNLYCMHIDTKAPLLFHRTVQKIASCFPNVFVATHLDKIKWGDVSILFPALNCMRDMVRKHWGKWKYFINLTGQEMPLRTNYELVQISKIFNGSNDIAGSAPNMEMERVKYKWGHRWSKTYEQMIFYNTFQPKDPPRFNLTFYKGELHGFFSRNFARYIVEHPVAQEYLEWCKDSGHPSEHYWNVLNYNRHLGAPGGYQGPQDLADIYGPEPIVRAKNWVGLYKNRHCEGKVVRGICVYGVGDLPWLQTRPELFANKFHLNFHYLGYDCMESRHRNRTRLKDQVDFNRHLYEKLPTVIYGRKDGV